jgi:hypothetical protein
MEGLIDPDGHPTLALVQDILITEDEDEEIPHAVPWLYYTPIKVVTSTAAGGNSYS